MKKKHEKQLVLAKSKGTGLASPNFKSTWKSMHRSKKNEKGKTGGF